jgi:hypothetical protein
LDCRFWIADFGLPILDYDKPNDYALFDGAGAVVEGRNPKSKI